MWAKPDYRSPTNCYPRLLQNAEFVVGGPDLRAHRDLCRDRKNLGQDFLATWNRRCAVDRNQIDREREHFLHGSCQPYENRLHAMIQALLKLSRSRSSALVGA